MSEKRCYTVQELQEILGVSRPTIYNLLKKKEFRWIQLDGGKYRIETTKKLIAQRKELEKRKKAEESKKRTHRLCQIGGAVESVLGCPIEEEDFRCM